MLRSRTVALVACAWVLQTCGLLLRHDESEKAQTVAWCIVGLSRTFTKPKVYKSLRMFLEHSGGVGIMNKDTPDVFAYMSPSDHVSYYIRDGVNNSKKDIRKALKHLNTVNSHLFEDPIEVTSDTLDDHVENLDECFSDGFWQLRHRMVGSINQILHMQGCVDMIFEEEKKLDQKYDIVVLARPDILYYPPPNDKLGANFFDEPRHGVAIHESDHLFALPRRIANRLASNGAKILDCSPGELCCHRVCQSEDMFEFKLGFPIKYSGSCGCTTETTQAVLKKSWDLYGESTMR